MNNTLINSIAKIVEKACKSKNNVFGEGVWENHILEVVKYADALAIERGADREICVLAALLHDYAGIYDYKYYKKHHIHGMKAAEILLSQYDYPQDKINAVKAAIYSHRASVKVPYSSKEAECVADADAMAHIHRYDTLVVYAHDRRKLSWLQSRRFVSEKIERSFNKMSDYAKEMFFNQYLQIVNQLKAAC